MKIVAKIDIDLNIWELGMSIGRIYGTNHIRVNYVKDVSEIISLECKQGDIQLVPHTVDQLPWKLSVVNSKENRVSLNEHGVLEFVGRRSVYWPEGRKVCNDGRFASGYNSITTLLGIIAEELGKADPNYPKLDGFRINGGIQELSQHPIVLSMVFDGACQFVELQSEKSDLIPIGHYDVESVDRFVKMFSYSAKTHSELETRLGRLDFHPLGEEELERLKEFLVQNPEAWRFLVEIGEKANRNKFEKAGGYIEPTSYAENYAKAQERLRY